MFFPWTNTDYDLHCGTMKFNTWVGKKGRNVYHKHFEHYNLLPNPKD